MSIMTRGIIGQPYNLAMHSGMSRRQFYSHAQALLTDHDSAHKHWANESNNVQALTAELVRLKAENEALRNPMRLECGQGALDYVDGWNACADHIKNGGSHD